MVYIDQILLPRGRIIVQFLKYNLLEICHESCKHGNIFYPKSSLIVFMLKTCDKLSYRECDVTQRFNKLIKE